MSSRLRCDVFLGAELSRLTNNSQKKEDHSKFTETIKVSVDDEPVELSLWDIRGIDYEPSSLSDTQVALVCFSINIGSTDAKGKHLGRVSRHPPRFPFSTLPKLAILGPQTSTHPSPPTSIMLTRRKKTQWVTEVNRNCPSAAIILVGLKSDIRRHARTVEKLRRHGKALVTPGQGEQLRESIGAARYLECSARTGDGVAEVLEEAARTALRVRNNGDGEKEGRARRAHHHMRPLSRIGKFLGLGGHRVGEE